MQLLFLYSTKGLPLEDAHGEELFVELDEPVELRQRVQALNRLFEVVFTAGCEDPKARCAAPGVAVAKELQRTGAHAAPKGA